MKLTNSQEEYLKVIYLLSKTEKEVRVTDIAQKLKITKPSVNLAIKNLKEFNLVNYKTYGNISLTEEGKNKAKEILKRYDIIKMFLTEVLEVDNQKAQEEAKTMKHAISKETEEKLQRYMIQVLKLEELECGCNMDNEKCRSCARIIAQKTKVKQQRKEEK